jgi:hypothetical protein
MTQNTRRQIALIVLLLPGSRPAYGQIPLNAQRDKAIQRIQACVKRNEVSSRECKHQNRDVAFLVDSYNRGDKSVLPVLLQFTYLTDFYDEALVADRDGFLNAMAQLPEKQQQDVAYGIAGGWTFQLKVDRFTAIRASLASVPEDSNTKAVANLSLRTVEAQNAALFQNYFPPGAFSGGAGQFRIRWYSTALYRLGEKPLFPPPDGDENTFRFTHVGAFPRTLTLTFSRHGSAQLKANSSRELAASPKVGQPTSVSADEVSEFLNRINRAHFWDLSTEESQQPGLDGAEWILEGVQNGRYHVVVRWCPGLPERSAEAAAFAESARFLFQLAGEQHNGGC